MPVRPAMQPLIDLFRLRGDAAPETETFNGETYWTDQQLQDLLDGQRDWRTVRAVAVSSNGLIVKADIPKLGVYLDPDTFTFLDSTETELAVSATWSDLTKEFTLAAEDDDIYYLNAAFISLNGSLAELWQTKATHRKDYINFKAGQNKMDMQQEYNHCIEMRDYYNAKKMKLWTLQRR